MIGRRKHTDRAAAMAAHPSAPKPTSDPIADAAARGLYLWDLLGRARWGDLDRVWRGFAQDPAAALASARGL